MSSSPKLSPRSSPRNSESYKGYKLEDLPYDLAFQYMLYLGPRDLQSMCRLNKNFNDICSDENFWIKKLSIDYPEVDITDINKPPKKIWIELTVSARCEIFLMTQMDLHNLKREGEYYESEFEKYRPNPENDKIVLKYFEEIYRRNFYSNFENEYSLEFDSEVPEKLQHFTENPYMILNGNILVIYIRLKKTNEGKYRPLNEKEKQLSVNAMLMSFDYDRFERHYSKEYDKNFDYKYILYGRDGNFPSKHKKEPKVRDDETLFKVTRSLNISTENLNSVFNIYQMPRPIDTNFY